MVNPEAFFLSVRLVYNSVSAATLMFSEQRIRKFIHAFVAGIVVLYIPPFICLTTVYSSDER